MPQGRGWGYAGICSPLDSLRRLGRGYLFQGGRMPTEPTPKRTIVFFDGQNLFHAAKEAFGYKYLPVRTTSHNDSLFWKWG
jgi:hypothetical protein